MRIRTDDDVYRVDAVWLGPPKATFPWRARYVAWGVGLVVFLLVLTVERQLGILFGFFSTAWAFVITIAVTRLITSRINHERPLGSVLAMWFRELTTPREQQTGDGGAVSAAKLRVRTERPRPRRQRPKRTLRARTSGSLDTASRGSRNAPGRWRTVSDRPPPAAAAQPRQRVTQARR